MNCNQYIRHDGAVGFGFVITHVGKQQHSVAWPDDAVDRYMDDELKERSIKVSECGQPCQCYHRADGVIGVGFAIGERHAIAWPDRVGERLHAVTMQEQGITIGKACDGCEGTCEVDPESEVLGVVEETTELEPTTEPVVAVEPPKLEFIFDGTLTEANNIANYLAAFPSSTNAEVIAALNGYGLEVSSSQVSRQRKKLEPVQSDTSEATV